MSKDKVTFYLGFLVIVAVSLAVFYPSFQHTFRSDQIVYFANTREHSDVLSLCKDYYAYPMVRHYYPGDSYLFRPLVFILIGTEKGIFKLQYTYWHTLGFLIHMLTVWFLYRILYGLRSGVFAFLFSLLYACCYANAEIVIWEHINGYALFNAFIMGSLYYFKRSFDGDQGRKDLVPVVIFLMLSTFLHEWGCLFAALFGICFYFNNISNGRAQDNGKIYLFLLPMASFLLVYSWVNMHYQTGEQIKIQSGVLSKTFQASNIMNVLRFIPYYFKQLMFNGLFPTLISGTLSKTDRLFYVHRSIFSAEFPLNLTAVCAVIFFMFQGFSRAIIKTNKYFILLLGGLIACQLITLPLMRMPIHGKWYILQTSSYYGYFFWSYLLVLIFMMVDFAKFNLPGRLRLKYLAMASMAVLIVLNAHRTWSLNENIRTARWAWQQYIDKLNGFIDIHGKERGFSFFVKDDVPIGLKYRIKGQTQETGEDLALSSILYYPYYDPKDPKYLFFLDERGRLFVQQ